MRSHVDAEPPRIVVEAVDICRDPAQTEGALRQGLSAARAPRAGWVIAMRVHAREKGQLGLHAEGVIEDDSGVALAHRDLSTQSADCEALARAVGVWASLVLDAELQRAREATPTPDPGDTAITPWPPPAGPLVEESLDPATPDRDWSIPRDESHLQRDFGVGAFVDTGLGSPVLGVTIFALIETRTRGLFVRPALLGGQSLTPPPGAALSEQLWGAARFEVGWRIPGLYAHRHGLFLELAAGPEVGLTSIATPSGASAGGGTIPYLAIGPSVAIQGELGSPLALGLRGVGGVNIIRASIVNGSTNLNEPFAAGRIELALTWSSQ
jgi:hypothetical protein